MHFKKSALVLVFAVTFFSSCLNLILNSYTGIWFYTYTSEGISSQFNLTPASFICLQPDNNYTLDFGKFEYGKWQRNKDTLLLHSSSGAISVFLINYKMGSVLKLNTEAGVICDFEAQHYSFSKNTAQPFSLQDNQWRIHATHKETPAEIKMRLVNHCKFWKDYFMWAVDNNIEAVDVRATPSPITIYGNGFELKEFNDLPETWKNYFYDSADCKLADSLLTNVFMHNEIAWAHTDSKYKMYIGAFEQLEQFLSNKDVSKFQ
ncbi:MAG: hypothetical protein ABJB05_13515 [Parafilimonas sp.]